MSKKEMYKGRNLLYLEEMASSEGVVKLPCGVLYKVIEQGSGTVYPVLDSVVTVQYRGTLIDGREFDNSRSSSYPAAFRLNQLIEGWQQALLHMRAGDRWMIYIPYTLGYGSRTAGTIPGFSTLIFEVELLDVA